MKKTRNVKTKKKVVRKTKKVEYIIVDNSESAIVVKFNQQQLKLMLNALEKSGAQEIGVSVEPI